MKKDLKYCDLELKDLNDEKGIVAFYFSSFNTKDADGDTITAGAFDKTFSENKARVKHFRNHQTNEVPGTIIELGKDEKGAFAISKLALKTTVGLDTYEQYKAGIIKEHSFGYNVIKHEGTRGKDRILKEVRLHEVSSLTAWGMNEYTPVISMKSIDEITSYMEKLNIMLKSEGITDEKAKEIVAEYDKLSETILTLKNRVSPIETPVKAIDYGFLVNNFQL